MTYRLAGLLVVLTGIAAIVALAAEPSTALAAPGRRAFKKKGGKVKNALAPRPSNGPPRSPDP